MNVLPFLPTIGSGQSSTLIEFGHTYQGPWKTELPGLGPRLPLESPDGQTALAKSVEHAARQLHQISEAIRGIVATNAGAVLVGGYGFERTAAVNGDAVRAARILALTSAIREPTDHCADQRVMWPVHRRPVAAGNQATISASLGDAPLHTGSAFSHHPECTP